jgi:site-specific recombinase XerC
VQRVKDFAAFLGRSPDTVKSEDVRGFRLHLASSGAGAPKINATVSALRFFFNVTLDRPELAKHLSFIGEPRKVPVVLSPEEVARFLEAAPIIIYKAALSVAYGAGLRVSREVTASSCAVRVANPASKLLCRRSSGSKFCASLRTVSANRKRYVAAMSTSPYFAKISAAVRYTRHEAIGKSALSTISSARDRCN